jgi:soluble lytic murein transglycosylase
VPARLIGVALVLVAATLSNATEAVHHGYWLAAVPEGPAEAALREALTGSAFGGAPARAAALARVSATYPGTHASGLARLAAGLALVDAAMAADALALVRHPDVLERTSLADHALYASARALEASLDPAGAGAAYMAAADMRPGSPVVCPALFAAADAFAEARLLDRGLGAAERALADCPSQGARALKRKAELHELKGDPRAAALAYDQLDREHAASSYALESAPRLKALAGYLPAVAPSERASRSLAKAQALLEAGRGTEALALLRAVEKGPLTPEQRDLLRVRLGRCLLAARGTKTAEAQFAAVAAGSVHEAEAAYELARLRDTRGTFEGLESVATRFPGTPWGERALLDLANEYQKDARDVEALPYYRRMLAQYPTGRYGDRAAWRVGWGEYRAARWEEAALVLERAARQHPSSSFTPGFLYWAGRARRELRQDERARQLLEEAVQRYKHTYHGMRAAQWLATLPAAPGAPPPTLRTPVPDPRADISADELARIEQLLLIDRLSEALEELQGLAPSPTREATIAWIEWRRGRLRPAITAMKRAYPGHRGEAGDQLPEDVWRILYPIEFREAIEAKAANEGLDAALVAALVCQESTFDPGAVSRAGARGLMQVIPPTARTLARSLGMRYRTSALHEPSVSLEMGTRYLRQMLDRFGGREERALAAYNAGPHRVEAWTAARPEIDAEEFIESIPFTETRNYVMVLLASRQHYRRLYALSAQHPARVGSAQP